MGGREGGGLCLLISSRRVAKEGGRSGELQRPESQLEEVRRREEQRAKSRTAVVRRRLGDLAWREERRGQSAGLTAQQARESLFVVEQSTLHVWKVYGMLVVVRTGVMVMGHHADVVVMTLQALGRSLVRGRGWRSGWWRCVARRRSVPELHEDAGRGRHRGRGWSEGEIVADKVGRRRSNVGSGRCDA